MSDNLLASYATVRRYCRLEANIPVRVFLGEGQPTSARGHDIGMGGMALYIPLGLAVGTVLRLSFQLPYSRVVFGVHATIRNCQGFRYGVEFLGLNDLEAEELRRITSILELTA